MPTEVDFGVLIGRFQPFHFGHLRLVKDALAKADKLLILIGSANRPRLERNPWTADERSAMIWAAINAELGPDDSTRITTWPIADRLYDYPAWLTDVQHAMRHFTGTRTLPSVGLFGHKRDHTSFYLDDFPEWKSHITDELGDGGVEATHIRNAYFKPATKEMFAYLEKVAPMTTVDFLREFRGSRHLRTLLDDINANAEYKTQWGAGPHSTVDSVFLRSGRVLMVRRGSAPGKGLRALPGGFLDLKETLFDGALRELSEETLIDLLGIPNLDPVDRRHLVQQLLRAAYRGRDIFDDPHRSERARIITTAHLFDLGNGHLPPVKGADDAVDAEWVSYDQIKDDECFDDHAFIIRKMITAFGGRHDGR